MRSLAVLPLLLVLTIGVARADSWMAPRPQLAGSLDGRWYVIVNPTEKWTQATFQLVRRAEGAEPRPAPPETYGGPAPEGPPRVEPGDTVVASGRAKVPMEVLCLDGGRGFVLFETYANLGYGTVLERFDGKGVRTWSVRLDDLFSAEEIEAFTHSVSSIWWYRGLWGDEEAGDVVILYGARDAKQPRVLRVKLADGTHRAGTPQDVLARIGRGHAGEQIAALKAAEQLGLEARHERARAAVADKGVPLEARVHFAMHLYRRGDPTGKDLVVGAAQEGNEPRLRAFAVEQLPELIGAAALPLLERAMRSADGGVWSAAEKAFRSLGGRAVATLVAMAQDETATEKYRLGAVHALWNMRGEAMEALPVLERLAKSAPPSVAKAADSAAEALRRLRRTK